MDTNALIITLSIITYHKRIIIIIVFPFIISRVDQLSADYRNLTTSVRSYYNQKEQIVSIAVICMSCGDHVTIMSLRNKNNKQEKNCFQENIQLM